MPPHAISSATISFGLVSVPVKLYSATQSKNVSFNLLHAKDKSRLKQQYVCTTCNETVERSDMVKGYEYSKNQYAIVSDDELKSLQEKTDQSIEIEEFVPITSIDPVCFDKAYLLGPDKGGQKAYRLLTEAMERAGRGAVARLASRGRMQLALVRQTQGGLMLHTLYYSDEVRGFDEIDRGGEVQMRANEIDLAIQLIEQLGSEKFQHDKYADDYRGKVLSLIDRKVAGEEIATAAAPPAKAQVIDLMEALKASLAARKGEKAQQVEPEPQPERKPARGKASAGGRRAKAR